MNFKNEHLYDEETLDFCRHARIFASVDRLYILGVLKENTKCRVTQLVMETGLSYRQVYYQLTVLRNIGYISTQYDKGRYLISFSFGWHKGQKMMDLLQGLAKNIEKNSASEKNNYLKLV